MDELYGRKQELLQDFRLDRIQICTMYKLPQYFRRPYPIQLKHSSFLLLIPCP